MKSNFLSALVGICLSLLLSFKIANEYFAKRTTAEVDVVQGISVFVKCKPVKEYTYLGTVKAGAGGIVDGAQNAFLKKVKKEYPTADGIIMRLGNGFDNDYCDAIKFSE